MVIQILEVSDGHIFHGISTSDNEAGFQVRGGGDSEQ